MSAQQVLDVLERLVTAAGHPDIVRVEQFGGSMGGLAIVYRSGATAYLSPVTEKATAVGLPGVLPEYQFRIQHALRLLVDVLEVAKPSGWRWRTVGIDGVALSPCGLEVDGPAGRVVFRAIGGSPTLHDADPAVWAGWSVPGEVANAV
jgi:hypothetical protein